MPDGPRRSARIAELSKKRSTSEVKIAELHPKRGRRVGKGNAAVTKPSQSSQNPPPEKPASIQRRKTRGRKAVQRATYDRPDVEHQPPSKKEPQRRRVTKGTATRRTKPSRKLLPKILEVDAYLNRERAGAILSREALQRLETATANDPFPEDLSTYRPASTITDMPKTATNKTTDSVDPVKVYSKAFRNVLKRQGILEQQYLNQKATVPTNFEQIRSAITQERPHSPPPDQFDFEQYAQAVINTQNEDAVRTKLFDRYFGVPLNIEDGHIHEYNQTWTKYVAVVGTALPESCTHRPKPDYAEGIDEADLPEWMCRELKGTCIPSEVMAFPNFVAEYKRNASMYIAHTQNRHCGSIASQAYHEYYSQIRKTPDESWDIAKVGSVEFNGDVMVGNVHWVSKGAGGKTDRDHRRYHMTRALCRFTCGLKFEDFKEARKEARNFRDYFWGVRDHLREECTSLQSKAATPPQANAPSNPSPSVVDQNEREPEGSSTECRSPESAEPEEGLTPEPSTRITRKRGKRAQGNTQRDTSGRNPKKRKNGNAAQSSEGSSTERPNSEYAERQEDPTPTPSTRITRRQASVLNRTNLSFKAQRLGL